jgi:hypothetical protein
MKCRLGGGGTTYIFISGYLILARGEKGGGEHTYLHCKKGIAIFPSPDGMSLTSLAIDIPAGDGKIASFFYSVGTYSVHCTRLII